MKKAIIVLAILIAVCTCGIGAGIMMNDPPPLPDQLETHGYYYFTDVRDYGFYTTLGGQQLEITDMSVVLGGDPIYGTMLTGNLRNGLGFVKGQIWWWFGGVRDSAFVRLDDGTSHEMDLIQLPHGVPIRSHGFITPLP